MNAYFLGYLGRFQDTSYDIDNQQIAFPYLHDPVTVLSFVWLFFISADDDGIKHLDTPRQKPAESASLRRCFPHSRVFNKSVRRQLHHFRARGRFGIVGRDHQCRLCSVRKSQSRLMISRRCGIQIARWFVARIKPGEIDQRRAIATRCCSPPRVRWGGGSARSFNPTRASNSRRAPRPQTHASAPYRRGDNIFQRVEFRQQG